MTGRPSARCSRRQTPPTLPCSTPTRTTTSTGLTFTPAALIGFETVLTQNAEPVVEDLAKKLASSDSVVHADEWQKLIAKDSPAFVFLEDIKQFVKRACTCHRLRRAGQFSASSTSFVAITSPQFFRQMPPPWDV